MRWLITGASGMLGNDLVELLDARGENAVGTDRTNLDITDFRAVASFVRGFDVVVNCAAWTAVDDAETHEDAAFVLNAAAPAVIARAAAATDARLVQISTDYVFDGLADSPYPEDAPIAPRSAYGRTKAAGEWAVRAEHPGALVVRTAWLYGAHGTCFPRTIARLARERGAVSVVDDQVGQPTWTRDVARVIADLVAVGAGGGTYHATSSDAASWYAFAREVVTVAGLDVDSVSPTTSDAFPRPAPRPAYSVLAHDGLARAGVAAIGEWRERWAAAGEEVLALA